LWEGELGGRIRKKKKEEGSWREFKARAGSESEVRGRAKRGE
jgi:hypothetical protein